MANLASDPEVRITGLGGSDASAAMGMNPWKTRYQLYLEKIGELPQADLSDNDAVRWGVLLEDLVAQEYARKTDCKVRRNNRTLRHPDYPFMMAHLDREVVGQDKLLECKTAGQYMVHEWGDEGTAEVPEHYLIQCLQYLVVTGKSEIDLAVLIGGRDHRIYNIKRADFEEECENLPKALAKFWDRVQRQDPPDPATAGDLGILYPSDTKQMTIGSEDDQVVAMELAILKDRQKAMKVDQANLEFKLKESLADAGELHYNGKVLATFKDQTSRRLNTKELKKDHPALAAEYTTESKSRVLRLKMKAEG